VGEAWEITVEVSARTVIFRGDRDGLRQEDGPATTGEIRSKIPFVQISP